MTHFATENTPAKGGGVRACLACMASATRFEAEAKCVIIEQVFLS